MNMLLAFPNPLEFLLRYTVIAGVIVAIIGTALCMMAKKITMTKRQQSEINRQDRLYVTLMLLGLSFILVGMILIALPIDATFFVG